MSKVELNSKESLIELISRLPMEKRRNIAELLSEAGMVINSIDCELHGTELEHFSLFDGEEYPTLWCQIYGLEKLFRNI